MKRTLIQIINFIVFLSIGVILLYFAFKDVDLESLVDDLKNVNYFWVSLSLVAGFIAYVSRAYRWGLLIRPLGYSPSLINLYNSLMLGYLANFALPRLGEVTRCGVLARKENAPMDSLIGTVIIERTIDLIALLTILVITLLVKINYFGKFIYDNILVPGGKHLVSALKDNLPILLILILAIILSIYFIRRKRKRLVRISFFRKFRRILKGVAKGIKTVSKMKNRKEFLIHTLIIWVMYYLMAYLVVFSFDVTAQLQPLDGLFLLVIGSIGMALPVQGGIGAYHWITSLGLTLYGISKADGLVYATIAHESQAVMAILLGIIAFAWVFIFQKRKKLKPNKA